MSALGDTWARSCWSDVALAILVCCLAIQTAAGPARVLYARDQRASVSVRGPGPLLRARRLRPHPAIISAPWSPSAILVVDIGNGVRSSDLYLSVSIVIVYLRT